MSVTVGLFSPRSSAPISRREMLAGAISVGAAILGGCASANVQGDAFRQSIAALERRHGGRLGAAVLDMATTQRVAHRGDERFPLCSTFKFLAAACVLSRVDHGQDSLSRRVFYSPADLVTYSPVTEKHAGAEGMRLGDICAAAVTLSDNTAGNLLLDSFGGPAGLTEYARTLGDGVTRLDRRETELNEAAPGDPRDTTTPLAMLANMRKLLFGSALSEASRDQLISWIVANKTGDNRLRAGMPKDWRVGDKTGGGGHGATNDIAVVWPPNRAPIIVTAYYVEAQASDGEREAVLADVGRFVAAPGTAYQRLETIGNA